MALSSDDREALETLEYRLANILPAEYQACYETVAPVSMGSAGLKYDADGKVAWNEMWATFCDLAMAGGPPHKGTLLEPADAAEVEALSDRYREVVGEICRGITMVTDLKVQPFLIPGWVQVECDSEGMAGWLVRAIVMENVSARCTGTTLDLPAGPNYRLPKEIKNVVTVIAKTHHYWSGHMWRPQQRVIAEIFEEIATECPLVEPALSGDCDDDARAFSTVAEAVGRSSGLRASHHRYKGWLGVECPSIGAAVWMMRTIVATNVLARREGTVLFVPINPVTDPHGRTVAAALALIHRLAATKGLVG